ncbi:MAG: RNA polymerase sigma factor [Ignavibacteriales bacterium]
MRFNDRSVAIKILEGDIEAFEMFIDSFKSRVFSYCLRMTNDYSTAEELTQDTFVKAYRGISAYDWHKASLSTWIYTICRNTCFNHLRDAARQPGHYDLAGYEKQLSNRDDYLSLEQRICLYAALDRLTVEEREIILMKDYLDIAYHEIGQIMGLPTGTVKSRIHSIRIKLRNFLASEEYHAK